MKLFKTVLLGCILVGFHLTLHAQDAKDFKFDISTTNLTTLTFNPALQEIKAKTTSFNIASLTQIDNNNVNSVSSLVLVKALYVRTSDVLNLELSATLSSQTVSVNRTLADIDRLWDKWINNVLKSSSLEDYSQSVQKNTFNDNTGFSSQIQLKKKGTYNFIFVAHLTDTKNDLVDSSTQLKEFKRFVNFIESDTRSKTILENNTSQRPVFLYRNEKGLWEAHHPFHSIIWDPRKKSATYEYIDFYSDIQDLWEVRKIKKDRELSSFIDEAGTECQIRMQFISKKEFSATIVNRKSGKIKNLKMIGSLLSVQQ